MFASTLQRHESYMLDVIRDFKDALEHSNPDLMTKSTGEHARNTYSAIQAFKEQLPEEYEASMTKLRAAAAGILPDSMLFNLFPELATKESPTAMAAE